MKDPVPYIVATPLPSNILEWHYVVAGPENSLYEGGYFHGKLVFPSDYPFKPPSIYMITPNGRFKTNTRLCLSISDFHPDTWNPAWSVSTILTGLLSFMLEESPTLGSITTTAETKKRLAQSSLSFNVADKMFVELFPEMTAEIRSELAEQERKQQQLHQEATESRDGTQSSGGTDGALTGSSHVAAVVGANDYRQFIKTTASNVAVLLGVAAFAYTVKYVLISLVDE